jgi:hypothetical protein|tara:strand:- start:37 stop:168 length:132 start_codon:yes stop_codon:yes gene_type:complete
MQISSNNSFTLGQTIMKKDKKSIGFQAFKKALPLDMESREEFL